jgi:hypothetical protein
MRRAGEIAEKWRIWPIETDHFNVDPNPGIALGQHTNHSRRTTSIRRKSVDNVENA